MKRLSGMPDDWRSRLDLSSPTDDHFISWWVRSVLQDTSTEQCLYFDSVDGRPTDWNELVNLAVSLGRPVMRWTGSPESAPWHHDADIGSTIVLLEHGVVVVSREIGSRWNVLVGTTDEALCGETIEKFKPLLTEHRPNAVMMLASIDGQLEATEVGTISSEWEPGNYVTGVSDAFDATIEDLQNSSPAGRLVLLEGPPGTGKSFWLKALVAAAPETVFLYMPSSLIGTITGPSLFGQLAQLRMMRTSRTKNGAMRPLVLLMEDADYGIVKRAGDNYFQISDLLNLADGIPGELLDIRIIATTNARRLDIDEAVLRPGRLARRVEFSLLEPGHAQCVYDRLVGTNGKLKFSRPVTLAEVYASALSGSHPDGQKPPAAPPGFSR